MRMIRLSFWGYERTRISEVKIRIVVRFGAEIHYSVIQPDDVAGADWNFRFYVIPAVPSALFSWMQ